jgi:threonine-phosphate decarboxylase
MIEHGGNRYDHVVDLDFSVNVNPYGMPESAVRAACQAIENCSDYPDPECRELKQVLVRSLDCPAEWLRFGNGAADLIYRLAAVFQKKTMLVLAPTFGEYKRAFESFGSQVRCYFLQREQGFFLQEDFLEEITEEIDCVFLCNPNNPTGRAMKRNFMERILRRCEQTGTFLMVDECFLDFLEQKEQYDSFPLLCASDQILLLRAFTKQYAMPGLRLGYCICKNGTLLSALDQYAQPWGVSIPAQAAGIAALSEDEYLDRTRELLVSEREKMVSFLKQIGCVVTPSQANFLLFRAPCCDLKERLLEHRILIRSCQNFDGLDEYDYRIAIRTAPENERLRKAIKQCLNK